MGLFDWLGPTSLTKRRGWDALPAVQERKAGPSWLIDDQRAVIISPLISGPGATDLLYGRQGDGNSAVFACLQVIATAIAEPPIRVYRLKAGDRSELDDTPLGDLLARPNPHMTLSALLSYLSTCLHIDGNGYWRKLRAGNPDTGNVVELWPISPTRIEPRTTHGSGDFISYYRYYVRPGVYEDIAPENIVHFRMGLKDGDHRLGDGPIKRLAREVSSDGQATRYADRLLSNLAINGLSLEFDKDAPAMTQADADEAKAKIQSAYGGDNIGKPAVLSPGAKLVSHGFSPEQMDLKVLHTVPEERISAVLGVPAIVAGLGAGLMRSTFANFKEAREAFTEMKLVPFWRAIGDVLTMSLVPDFVSERGVSVAFMIDDVRALQDDQNAKAVRLKTYVEAGILDVDEARAEIGREPKPQAQPATQPALPAPKSQPILWGRPVDPYAPIDWVQVREARNLAHLAEYRPQAFGIKYMDDDYESKSLDDLPGEYETLREDQQPGWETALRTFLASQLRRANAALRAGGDTADALIVEGEATLLGETLRPLQTALLSDVSRLVVAELGIAFDLDDSATRAYLRSAGGNISGITATTRDQVRAALLEGQAAGEGIDQLAARLRDLPAFGDRRARMVARTELGHASNTAALANYRASGVVVGVRVFDGDYDAACAAMNGRTFALGSEPATLQHPNCRRAFAPIVDAAELTRSA